MKRNKRFGFIIIILTITFFLGVFSSCSNKGCIYSHEKYRKKSTFSKSRTQNKPGKDRHFSPVRKKYIVNHKKKNILGNK